MPKSSLFKRHHRPVAFLITPIQPSGPVPLQNWGQLFQGQPGDGRRGGNRRIMGGTEGGGVVGVKGKNLKKEEKESIKKNDSEGEQEQGI